MIKWTNLRLTPVNFEFESKNQLEISNFVEEFKNTSNLILKSQAGAR